jgi:uncharacterized protein (DUF983 family)
MLKKGSKLYSILTGSCPRCHEESMYIDKNPYHLSRLYAMNEKCGHCDLHYKIEPSFFYGAMYVSYGLTVAIGIATFIIMKVFIGLDLFDSFIAIIVALIATTPITFRLSRNIYINIFVHYDPDATKNAHND